MVIFYLLYINKYIYIYIYIKSKGIVSLPTLTKPCSYWLFTLTGTLAKPWPTVGKQKII
ncbi:MAG: hypothetical protein ON057_001771 [Glomeribacter sp. 1016415]|nr:hypothetical protein [Glomeribacter sp. 1016415]